MKNTFQAS